MVSRRSYLGIVAAFLLAAHATAAELLPVSLTAAVARTAAQPGWRTEQLADGRIVTIGVAVANDVTHVIGITCGAAYRPEIAVDARGAIAMPRAFLVESEGQLKAVPIAPGGAGTQGADALLNVLVRDAGSKLSIDDRDFPVSGARAALEPMWKQCEQLFGWRITEPHRDQIAWTYDPQKDGRPTLMVGVAAHLDARSMITCDPDRGSVTIVSSEVPKEVKRGQKLRLTIEAGGQNFDVTADADPDVLRATVAEPDAMLKALDGSTRLTLRTKTWSETLPLPALGALLPRFRHACALP